MKTDVNNQLLENTPPAFGGGAFDLDFRGGVTPLLQPYKYDTDAVSYRTGLKCEDPTLTQQNTAEQTDINYIVSVFAKTGILPQPIQLPTYGDFTGVSDYREALELIKQAEDGFNSLPADARAYFANNPANLLDYLDNAPDPQILADLGIAEIVQLPQKPDDKSEAP